MVDLKERLNSLTNEYKAKQLRLVERKKEIDSFNENYQLYLNRAKALTYITNLSEDSTKGIRDYLESVINRALDTVFGRNVYRFYLQSDMENQKIELILSECDEEGQWQDLDLSIQVGDGMGQVIGLLYSIILTEITHHRMLFIEDEILGGLHKNAIRFVKKCLREFSKHNAQFIIIEYTLEEFGLQYDLEKNGNEAKIVGRTKFDFNGESTKIA